MPLCNERVASTDLLESASQCAQVDQLEQWPAALSIFLLCISCVTVVFASFNKQTGSSV